MAPAARHSAPSARRGMRSVSNRSPHKETMTVTKIFTIALLACVAAGTAASAQQNEQQKDKEKSGAFSQPAEPQPVVMPAAQRPEEWKFKKEKEQEANQAVEDKKASKKKAEEDKKA